MTGREDNIAKESTLAILPVCYFLVFLKSFGCLPHAGYGGGTTTRWRVVTTIKGTRGQHRQRTYVGYTTCLVFFFWLLHVSLWSWLWQRDNDEENGGRRDEKTTSPKKVRWLYYLSVVFWGGLISLLFPTCWLWWSGNDEVDGGDDDQRDERTTSPKNVCWLYYLSVVFFWVFISLVSHMLAMAEG